MDKNFKVRLFKEDDLDEVTHINWTCLPENYVKSFFRDIHYRFPKAFFVASVDNKVVGYIMCRVEKGFSVIKRLSIAKKGHIISIAVLPEYRSRGIGQVLVFKILESMSSEYNVSECYLEVRPSNRAAINLYKKFTFKMVREISGYYRDGESAYVMTLDLSKNKLTPNIGVQHFNSRPFRKREIQSTGNRDF